MNTNRLSLKDYIIIYLIIFLIVAFLGGFFLGAKVMENELQNSLFPSAEETVVYKEDEIITFYEQIFAPINEWNKAVHNIINVERTFDEANVEYLINDGELIKASIDTYSFESQYLTKATSYLKENLSITLYALDMNKSDLLETAFEEYLLSQKYFYQGIWAWEQTSDSNKDRLNTDTSVSWTEWNKASLNQKNYIVALILEEKSIDTFLRPEDITVHIDAYQQANAKEKIELEVLVDLLIASHAIQEKDFLKYKNAYSDLVPKIPNFE